jgi:hypothetical protein
MQSNHCDSCGKETFINPKIEKLFEEREVEIPIMVDGVPSTMKDIQRVPVLVPLLRQDHKTGVMQQVMVQKVKELEERCIFIRLDVGDESVFRDLCRDCVDKLRPLFGPLWKELSDLIEKE